VHAQQIRDNPKTPLHKNPGRILKLKEVMRINGDGENYYFIGANRLQIDSSENIYIRDFWSTYQRANFLVFSPDGQFLRDLYRQGEGPGEIQSAFDFTISEPNIFVYDSMKRKMIILKNDGNFMNEFKMNPDSSLGLLGTFKDWLIFMREDKPHGVKTSRLYDKKNVIVYISKNGEQKKDFYTFINQEFLWVKTSIKDEKKESLFDLFDSKGQFQDSFFINIKGRIVRIDKDFVYISEKDEDLLQFIVKYEILDSKGVL